MTNRFPGIKLDREALLHNACAKWQKLMWDLAPKSYAALPIRGATLRDGLPRAAVIC
jgi:hypothetical protein